MLSSWGVPAMTALTPVASLWVRYGATEAAAPGCWGLGYGDRDGGGSFGPETRVFAQGGSGAQKKMLSRNAQLGVPQVVSLDKASAAATLLLCGILASYTAVSSRQPVYAVGITLLIGGCAAYLLLRTRILSAAFGPTRVAHRTSLALSAAFLVFFSCSVASAHSSAEPYVRPVSYFVFTALAVATVAGEILACDLRGGRLFFTLCKMVTIALSLRWSVVLLYPGVVGVDPWEHAKLVGDLLALGHVSPDAGTYYFLPCYHVFTGMTSLITSLGYKYATMLSVNSLQAIADVLFVFLLGRAAFSQRVGLMAGLVLTVANYHVHMGFWTIPNTMGGTILAVAVYVLLTTRESHPLTGGLLLMLLMVSLILTHTVSSACMAVLLFTFWLAGRAYAGTYGDRPTTPEHSNTALLFTAAMLAYWMLISGTIAKFATLLREIFGGPLIPYSPQVSPQAPASQQVFAYLGVVLFYSLISWGLFYMISKSGNKRSFLLAAGGIALLGVTAAGTIVGVTSLLVTRWIYFSQVLAVLPIAVTIVLLYGLIGRKVAAVVLPVAVVTILAFFMVISSQVNIDNRAFFDHPRAAFTASELAAMQTVGAIWGGPVATDAYGSVPMVHKLNYQTNVNLFVFDDSFINRDYKPYRDKLLLIRNEIIGRAFGTATRASVTLDYDPRASLDSDGFCQVYTCGTAYGFVFIRGVATRDRDDRGT
jgi:hypothetical protein